MENEKIKSQAFELIASIWYRNNVKSRQQLHNIMQQSIILAIRAMLKFDKTDFVELNKLSRYSWFGCNSNGKGTGEQFYECANRSENTSAMVSYENFLGIKPFIASGKRTVRGSRFKCNNLVYVCTGFNEQKEITFVAYDSSKYVRYKSGKNEYGTKKLFKFSNSEWLEFRKLIAEY